MQVLLLATEKELNELLKEVFDVYESDTSETQATMADADIEPSDVQLSSTDNTNAQTEQSCKGHMTPRKLRNKDSCRHGAEEREIAHSHATESDTFQYPGHIPPLRYVFLLCYY